MENGERMIAPFILHSPFSILPFPRYLPYELPQIRKNRTEGERAEFWLVDHVW